MCFLLVQISLFQDILKIFCLTIDTKFITHFIYAVYHLSIHLIEPIAAGEKWRRKKNLLELSSERKELCIVSVLETQDTIVRLFYCQSHYVTVFNVLIGACKEIIYRT